MGVLQGTHSRDVSQTEETHEVLNGLQMNELPGAGGLHLETVKALAGCNSRGIRNFLQDAAEWGLVPADRKLATAVAIRKDG